LTPGQREAASISDGLVRIAVGLEDLEDLQSDCLRGFAALGR
jgi:O-succinylhomoserine sulfhydrylase